MMNNNKILTVSYGTFSCTLEGFEDSFGTMKAIAEYFRDLAADDRYFGAEPPQPDAEMLARIAQKEVSRRVQAREQDGKIVLSALEDNRVADAGAATPAAAAAIAAAPAVAGAVADLAPEASEPPKAETYEAVETAQKNDEIEDAAALVVTDVEDEVGQAEPAIETAALSENDLDALDETEQDVSVETAADIAQVPRDVPAEEAPTQAVAEAQDDHAETVEPIIEADEAHAAPIAMEAETAHAAEEEAFVEDENDIVPGQRDAEVEAFFADSPTMAPATDDMTDTAEAVPVDTPAPDSIAAKLQRIRAVVAQHEEADEDADYLEDEHAEPAAAHAAAEVAAAVSDVSQDAADIVAEARADLEDALDADEAANAPLAETEEQATDEVDEDDLSAILNRLEMETAAENAFDAPDADTPETAQGTDAVAAQVESADDGEDSLNNLFEEDDIAPAAQEDSKGLADVSEKITASDELSVTAQMDKPEQLGARRARVIKVKRADLEAAIKKGDLEEYDDEDGEDGVAEAHRDDEAATPALDDLAPARKPKTALSPEDEADLARELAALEADIEADSKAAPQAEDARKGRGDAAARSVLPSIDEGAGANVNRLMAETDHQMDEPESATRRDAFAHLRAAVAAKKADTSIATGDAKADGAYREDLAEVVRPRRPTVSSTRTERPDDVRPAPLKLVAEQRVDVEKPKAAGPVRPRRVAAVTEAPSEAPEGESFADFAADMGATTLPQLLEAAAAYMSFVEGREQFSRPQLMTKVRQAGGDEEFSREDGLRSFGQLLRTGKIEKIKGGRFTVSDDIGFRPDQRAAG